MCAHTSGKVRAYGQLSWSFNTTSWVRQGCPISLFLFEFINDDILHRTMDQRITSGINVLEIGNSFDLEYTDDIVCSLDSFKEAQATLNDLNIAAWRYGLSLTISECEDRLTDWTVSITLLTLNEEELRSVGKFTYLGSCIIASGNIADEIKSRITRPQAVYENLRHFWRRTNISLTTKGHAYNCKVRPTLIYGCETWSIHEEELHRLQVSDHRCLGTIGHICWKQKITDEEVRQMSFRSTDKAKGLADIVKQPRLRWLGHVLRMDEMHSTQKMMIHTRGTSWKKSCGHQQLTWESNMKKLTKDLAIAEACHLPRWGFRDSPHQWVRTLQDVARNRQRRRTCVNRITNK